MISIIGSGRVGSTIAFLIATSSLDDILLINHHKEKALGQALDISNAIPSDSSITVMGTDFSGLKQSEVIIISASTGTYSESRTELITDQVKMIKDIAKKIEGISNGAKVLVVSNPVDILTYFFQKESKFSSDRVIGVASSLDSSRLRYLLAKEINTNQSEIKNALVLGEHGDSMVPVFSHIRWNDTLISDILDRNQIQKIRNDLKFYWKILRKYKGPSIFGIAKHTFDIIKSIIQDDEISVPASVLVNGEYGISDVCLGVPIIVNKKGISEIQEISFNPSEMNSLKESGETIRRYIKSCI